MNRVSDIISTRVKTSMIGHVPSPFTKENVFMLKENVLRFIKLLTKELTSMTSKK